ncbi:IS66 family transposase [Magnetofaba australis]|uniref:Putative transposase IS66 n=2 Tax=Magnetofaba TaxID=1472292 RepID=A0A1Y2K9Q4_9PROT|nr:IS66 family transposase [Magnetofaba australis]OSM05943.1 putative transposase IS66 [Magnetofaba australis IT-1]OSM08750.1 putative transposase IS66 [Magnetofaba australis IT-1]
MDKLLNDLPESPEELREMLAVLLKERDSLQQQVGSLQQRADSLQEQVNLLKAWRFGRRSEKFSDHPSLFDEAEIEAQAAPDADIADEDGADETVAVAGHERSKGGRKPLPAHLPRREIIHDLPAEQKTCGVDGHALVEIGRDVSEQLEIIPAQVTVIRHVRLKYGCPHCHSGVVRANMPPQPIPKALATASMLAFVAVSKYADALPLYRQHTILARSGIDLPRSTLANWMIRCGQLVQPLINLLRDRMLEGGVIQMDETPVQVLREDGKPASSKSYMWVQRGGPPGGAVILFDYDATRQGRVPKELLADYKGWLQTDGYSGYLAMGKVAGIEHVGCWAHARRLFSDAAKAAGGKKSAKADYAIKLIGKLYAIEKRVRDKPPEERYAARQSEAPPILAKLREWLDKWLPEAVPSMALGKALGYLSEQWPRLIRYIEDGRLEIDNNLCENAIRPFTLGRKNWLFSNTVRGVKASANLYGLIETAKANGLEPFTYLRHLFEKIPAAQTVADFEALLPWSLNPDMTPKAKPTL